MPNFLRDRSSGTTVTNVELFFDLIYVYAVTQMSHHLLGGEHPTWATAFQTAILLGLIWPAWVYTSWITNWLDADRDPMRLLLIALMLCALTLSAALPEAFGEWGALVGILYAVMHIGRPIVVLVLLERGALFRNFARILAWSTVSGAFAVAGGLADGHSREAMWLAVIGIDLLGGAVGFWTPGLGRSDVRSDWGSVDGGHFAERCQAFILIALGESLVIIGSSMADEFHHSHVPTDKIVAFLGAFIGAVALWWIYFDRAGPKAAEVVENSDDPGMLTTSAYHWVHPLMIAGIIVTAAADELVFQAPSETAHGVVLWTVLGGCALFLLGHAIFTWVIWHVMPWTRLAAAAVLAVLGLVLPAVHATALVVGLSAGVVLLAVCVTDRRLFTKTYQETGTYQDAPSQ